MILIAYRELLSEVKSFLLPINQRAISEVILKMPKCRGGSPDSNGVSRAIIRIKFGGGFPDSNRVSEQLT